MKKINPDLASLLFFTPSLQTSPLDEQAQEPSAPAPKTPGSTRRSPSRPRSSLSFNEKNAKREGCGFTVVHHLFFFSTDANTELPLKKTRSFFFRSRMYADFCRSMNACRHVTYKWNGCFSFVSARQRRRKREKRKLLNSHARRRSRERGVSPALRLASEKKEAFTLSLFLSLSRECSSLLKHDQ